MLINNRTQPLLPILLSNIDWAEKVTICVAFFRNSGLQEILKNLKKKDKGNVQIIAGTGFYQTEPNALITAFNNKFKIYLQEVNSKKTFHPKVYLFKKGRRYRAIIGSSNMTKGGLVDNVEMSFSFDSIKNRATIKNLKEELETIKDSEYFEFVDNILTIQNYKVKYDKYKKIVDPAVRQAMKEVKEIHKFEVSNLEVYVKKYRVELEEEIEEKNEQYLESKSLMTIISKKRYRNANEFIEEFDEVNFHSAGVKRGRSTYYLDYKNIQKLLVLANNSGRRNRTATFTKAMDVLKEVKGMGVNNLTEILNAFRPNIFPVLNGRTIKVLESLGLKKYKAPNSFSVEEYFEYLDVMSEIKKKCEFTDFRATDLAISNYYRDEVKKK